MLFKIIYNNKMINYGATICLECDAGTFQSTSGCEECAAGYFNHSTGKSTCVDCGLGT